MVSLYGVRHTIKRDVILMLLKVARILIGGAMLALGYTFSFYQWHQVLPPTTDVALQHPIKLPALDGTFSYCTAGEILVCPGQQAEIARGILHVSNSTPCCQGVMQDPFANAGQQISLWTLFSVSWVLPISLFISYKTFVEVTAKGTPALGLFYAFSSCYMLTEWLKASVGRPRPNFYALEALANVTNNPYLREEGFRSFPSGHASVAMSNLFYTSLWLTSCARTKMRSMRLDRLSRAKRRKASEMAKGGHLRAGHLVPDEDLALELALFKIRYSLIMCTCYVPTICAVWVATTRVQVRRITSYNHLGVSSGLIPTRSAHPRTTGTVMLTSSLGCW
jgi:hypothetical protein